jgi:hypothetical protein
MKKSKDMDKRTKANSVKVEAVLGGGTFYKKENSDEI